MSELSFSQLAALNAAELENLARLQYTQMTPIQQQALPQALAGNDVLAQAQTGSGKTVAFGIPVLHKLNPRFFGVQGLILCPTRELCTQVADELRKLARFQANIKIVVLCGGVSIGPQIGSLEHGAHVVVGTPGRIKDHLRKQTLKIDQVQTVVLDEADRMLDMGFRDDILDIVETTPRNRQTLLFSATYPENIEQLSAELQHNPVSIKVEKTQAPNRIEQHMLVCDRNEKLAACLQAIRHFDITQAVVFCNTRQMVEDVNQYLRDAGFLSLALHGDMEQRDRDQVYIRFRQQSAHFLVATDVAARGLDVDDLQAVINYDLPFDSEVYVHRIGRTGRAGKEGLAISIADGRDDGKRQAIETEMGHSIPLLSMDELRDNQGEPQRPPMVTLHLAAGRKDKLRPGDILGALTNNGGIDGKAVGKIDVLDMAAYVAVARKESRDALEHLQSSKIKGRAIKVRRL